MKKVLSYGGGLDSFAMLLSAIDRRELPDWVVFVDTGDSGPSWEGNDPGEWPGTYRHIREVVMPLCRKHGIKFEWLTYKNYPVRQGTAMESRSLFDWFEKKGQIPVAGPDRICTTIAKVERFERWLDDHFPGEKVQVWIGFEAGEESRAAKDPNAGTKRKVRPGAAVRVNRFPLIEQRICRCRARDLVLAHGYAVPRKSACTYCPFGTRKDWRRFQEELPEQFERVAMLEQRKGLTGAGKKLSIKGFRTLKTEAGEEIGFEHTPIAEWVKPRGEASTFVVPIGKSGQVKKGVRYVLEREEKPGVGKVCPFCGKIHALECPKDVGCDYFEEAPGKASKASQVGKSRRLPVVKELLEAGRTPPRKKHGVISADELIREALEKYKA